MKMLIDIADEVYNKMRRDEALYTADANVVISAIETGIPLMKNCEDCFSRHAIEEAIANTIVNGESLGYVVASDILSDLQPVAPPSEKAVSFLADIAKSLAMIADKLHMAESEEGKTNG